MKNARPTEVNRALLMLLTSIAIVLANSPSTQQAIALLALGYVAGVQL